jgi:hypothetical protein
MASRVKLVEKPKLFSPQVIRSAVDRAGSVQIESLGSDLASNVSGQNSFRYDDYETGLKSTQELNVDFSEFQNHTFFSSAAVKTNVAFDKIVNDFPFDGTESDLEKFEDDLTGWENYVLEQFPKNVGYLFFSGTTTSENPSGGFSSERGTFIQVSNSTGYLFPGISKGDEGGGALDTSSSPFAIETFIFVPSKENDNQIICQRISGSTGYSLHISSSNSVDSCNVEFIAAGVGQRLAVSASLQKGSFHQVCTVFDNQDGAKRLFLYIDAELKVTSSALTDSLDFDMGTSKLIIGSGSSFSSFSPQQTLSGAIDDFRFFGTAISAEDQRPYLTRTVFQKDDMVLYFKFNEPSGSYGMQDVVLDSSGNSLHSRVRNYDNILRSSPVGSSSLINEDVARSPVLYPSYEPVAALNAVLLASASEYDSVNPNLITKLIPPHYFLEGQNAQGLKSIDGSIDDSYTSLSLPGTGKLGQTQTIMTFLFVWAKFFDEMKMFLDAFSNIQSVDYTSKDTIPSKFLPFLAKQYGFTLPSIFSSANIDQFIKGQEVNAADLSAVMPLRSVQNEIWKRILINLQDVMQSKGTRQGIRSILLASGIDPDGAFTIREYGGPSRSTLKDLRITRTETSAMLDMSGSTQQASTTYQGFGPNPFVLSPFLSSSRIEQGFPYTRNAASDGLLTSGSFTYEGIYSWSGRGGYFPTQSLARLEVTGSQLLTARSGLIANLIATSGTLGDTSLQLFVRPSFQTGAGTEPILNLILTGVNVFDGDRWSVSFGREMPRDDVKSPYYFIRCASQDFGKIKEVHETGSYFQETIQGYIYSEFNAFQQLLPAYNASGSIIAIGSQSIYIDNSSIHIYLNDVDVASLARETMFDGKVSKIRFWSKPLTSNEWREHVRNFKSLGVVDPLVNFNFTSFETGSFERLRVDVDIDQLVTQSDASGKIVLFDYSQNNFHMTGSSFEASKRVIKPATFNYSFISPNFDQAQSDSKVRVRSLNTLDPEYPMATTAPVYDVPLDEYPSDDTRFSIEYSAVAALNEDIVRIFSTLDFFNNAIGNPELLFSDSYPDLEQMRKIYFNRLEEKMNLTLFFQVFKWFDSSFSDLFSQILPRKTKFLGVNFVIESHMLERHKVRYLFDDTYLSDSTRSVAKSSRDTVTIDGNISKH